MFGFLFGFKKTCSQCSRCCRGVKYVGDCGDGMLVFVLGAIPLLVASMLFILNIAQNASDKDELNAMFQRAGEAGVQRVNSYGSLNKASVNGAMENLLGEMERAEGRNVARGKDIGFSSQEGAVGYGDHISTKFCSKDIFDENGVKLADNAPYVIQFTLSDSRGIGNSKGEEARLAAYKRDGISKTISYRGPLSQAHLKDTRRMDVNPNDRLKVMQTKAYVNMRSYWAVPGTDPCKTHIVDVSSTVFGSSRDVDFDKDYRGDVYRKHGWDSGENWAGRANGGSRIDWGDTGN